MSKKKTVPRDRTELSPPVTPTSVNSTEESPPKAATSALSVSGRLETPTALSDRLLEQLRASGEAFSYRLSFVANPTGPFANPIIECHNLLEANHFYGCMALADHLLLAMVRYVNEARGVRRKQRAPAPRKDYSSYRKTLLRLKERKLLDDVMHDVLQQFLVDKEVARRLDAPSRPLKELRRTAENLLGVVLMFELRIRELLLHSVIPQ